MIGPIFIVAVVGWLHVVCGPLKLFISNTLLFGICNIFHYISVQNIFSSSTGGFTRVFGLI